MKLHLDTKLFSETLRAASEHLDIKLEFVEKDYWITLVLYRLAHSKFAEDSVFKGGTSLSKGYNLIDRFSEDVDIAIVNNVAKSGNVIKTIIRTIEKDITTDLNELNIDGVTSKGSRNRKSVFKYATIDKGNANNKLIIEVNSFANPFPYQKLTIRSMVFDFLMQTDNEKYIEQYALQSFEVHVLSKEQTLLEKLVSLIRFSFAENPIVSISQKIRHFYDVYYLLQNSECSEFVASGSFKERFDTILTHDRDMFDEPMGWQTKATSESPFITDFPNIWKHLREKYNTELSALAYRPIPDEADVEKCFEELIRRIG